MSKLKVDNINIVSDSDALKAIDTTSLPDGEARILGYECYLFYNSALLGDYKADDDGGYWFKDCTSGSTLIVSIVADNYDFEANNATDISSVTTWDCYGVYIERNLQVILSEMGALITNWSTHDQLEKDMVLHLISGINHPLATTEQRNDLTNIPIGFVIVNSDTSIKEWWNGSVWVT